MHRNHSRAISRAVVRVIWMSPLIAALALIAGCVSHDAYELARKDAENARLLHQNEQRHALELAAANKRMKQQIDEMQASVREMRDNLARTEREWREARDELLRIKIDREQRRNSRERDAQLGLDSSKPLPPDALKSPADAPRPIPPDGDAARRKASPPDEVKQRLKTVLEQLQGVLQEF